VESGTGIPACVAFPSNSPVPRTVIIVILTRAAIAILALLLCSCDRLPETYPPPTQRQPPASTPDPSVIMVEMSDPDSAQHIVKDIYEPFGSTWRWTAKQPTVKVLVYATDNVRLSSDFTIWSEGLQQTGPIELSFFVNGHLLDKVRCATAGYQHFEKAVPADWLSADTESTISVDVDKLYVSPHDGKKFGFILTRLGFLR
jgi:hypothetical protein